jgi:hypothetical protein
MTNPRAPPTYTRSMFFDVTCQENRIYDYKEMQKNLEELANSYDRVELTSIGKSQGYGGPENAVDVWSLYICPDGRSEKTVFFVGGHHGPEFSGNVTPYLLAKRLLESREKGNPYVKKLLQDKRIIVIPQVDSDYYNVFRGLDVEYGSDDYWGLGYGFQRDRVGDEPEDPEWIELEKIMASELFGTNPDDIQEMKTEFTSEGLFLLTPNSQEVNSYGPRGYFERHGYLPLKQTISVRNAVINFEKQFGKIYMAFDYQEKLPTEIYENKKFLEKLDRTKEALKLFDIPWKVPVKEYVENRQNREEGFFIREELTKQIVTFALEEVGKDYPVFEGVDKFRRAPRETIGEDVPFSDFIVRPSESRIGGGFSFYVEAPFLIDQPGIQAQIEMNLIATDRILAEYCK